VQYLNNACQSDTAQGSLGRYKGAEALGRTWMWFPAHRGVKAIGLLHTDTL
jgi:hypothetical protein